MFVNRLGWFFMYMSICSVLLIGDGCVWMIVVLVFMCWYSICVCYVMLVVL